MELFLDKHIFHFEISLDKYNSDDFHQQKPIQLFDYDKLLMHIDNQPSHLNFPNHNFSFQKMNVINLYNVPPHLMNY